jgi:Tol biopolymer transport system component
MKRVLVQGSAVSSTTRAVLGLIAIAVLVTTAGVLARTAHATVPAANGLIAFAGADQNGDYQVFTVAENGQGLQQLTQIPGGIYWPHWSPDGRRIVFEDDQNGSCPSIAIINADGSNLVVLPNQPRICDAMPSFTPDGTHILFEHCSNFCHHPFRTDTVWVMRADGSNPHQISSGAGDGICGAPEASPDGSKVVFAGCGPGDGDNALFTASIRGAHTSQVTPFSSSVGGKEDWSPDGQRLLFTDHADYEGGLSANIDTINPDGTGLFHVTHFSGGEGAADGLTGSFSPDGRWIVFRYELNGSYGLYKIHPDGSDMQAILPLSSFKPRAIAWGPAPS